MDRNSKHLRLLINMPSQSGQKPLTSVSDSIGLKKLKLFRRIRDNTQQLFQFLFCGLLSILISPHSILWVSRWIVAESLFIHRSLPLNHRFQVYIAAALSITMKIPKISCRVAFSLYFHQKTPKLEPFFTGLIFSSLFRSRLLYSSLEPRY